MREGATAPVAPPPPPSLYPPLHVDTLMKCLYSLSKTNRECTCAHTICVHCRYNMYMYRYRCTLYVVHLQHMYIAIVSVCCVHREPSIYSQRSCQWPVILKRDSKALTGRQQNLSLAILYYIMCIHCKFNS